MSWSSIPPRSRTTRPLIALINIPPGSCMFSSTARKCSRMATTPAQLPARSSADLVGRNASPRLWTKSLEVKKFKYHDTKQSLGLHSKYRERGEAGKAVRHARLLDALQHLPSFPNHAREITLSMGMAPGDSLSPRERAGVRGNRTGGYRRL